MTLVFKEVKDAAMKAAEKLTCCETVLGFKLEIFCP